MSDILPGMYLLISGLWVNTAHIVYVEPVDEGKAMKVALSNGNVLRVEKEQAQGVFTAILRGKIGEENFDKQPARKRK